MKLCSITKVRGLLEQLSSQKKISSSNREYTTIVCRTIDDVEKSTEAFITRLKMSHTMFNDELNYVRCAEVMQLLLIECIENLLLSTTNI